MCGRIAHEWPAYTVADVANLPFTHFRALRTIFIRAKLALAPNAPYAGSNANVKVVDMDERLGIKDV